MPDPDAAMRSTVARIAAHESWAQTPDRATRTAPARAALLRKFEQQVDPNGTLPEAERLRRAESARKAFYQRLALKSAKVRRKRRAARTAAGSPESGAA